MKEISISCSFRLRQQLAAELLRRNLEVQGIFGLQNLARDIRVKTDFEIGIVTEAVVGIVAEVEAAVGSEVEATVVSEVEAVVVSEVEAAVVSKVEAAVEIEAAVRASKRDQDRT